MGTIKNYEKLLRLEGQSSKEQEGKDSMNEHTKRQDSWGVLCSSIVLLEEECLELTRTVTCMLEKCTKAEKLYENRAKKICNLNMRIERLDTVVFGQKIDCWLTGINEWNKGCNRLRYAIRIWGSERLDAVIIRQKIDCWLTGHEWNIEVLIDWRRYAIWKSKSL